MRALLLLMLSTASAAALGLPEAGRADAHMRTVPYDPMNRTAMVLTLGRVANVQFNNMEMIKRVIFSTETGPVSSLECKQQQQSGECAKDDAGLVNNLPLFGRLIGKTDLIVITMTPADGGHEHVYQFFLEVRAAPKDGADDPEATYGLQFTYAAQERQAAAVVAKATWQEKHDAAVKAVAEARLNTDVFYGSIQNWRYMAQGQFNDIAPLEAHDNGRITSLRYPGNTRVPSVFIVTNGPQRIADVCTTGKPSSDDSLGTEQVPQTTVMDDLVIVQQTAPHLRLRLGDEVVEVYNCAWDPIGANPGTGTSSPEVVRRVVSGK